MWLGSCNAVTKVTQTTDRAPSSARQWLALAAALFLLNLSLTFHNVWPTLWVTTRHELSVEIAALLLGMIAYGKLIGPLSRRAVNVLAVGLTVMCIGRYGEVTAPALYGRPVNLYWDAQHLPAVGAMLVEVAPLWLVALIGLGLIALLIGVFATLRWSLGYVQQSLAHPLTRRVVTGLAAGLVVLYMLGYTSLPVRTLRWYSLPIAMTYWRQASFLLEALDENSLTSLPREHVLAESNLARVAGADVYVMFVESYGAVAYDNPVVAKRVAQSRDALAEAVDATGRRAVSAFVESPTFGGASWLAHASLFTGLDVRENGTYNLLLTQRRDTLASRFARDGYRVLALMPGLKNEWPEGAFYGFDTIYGERALDYRGPEFGWWRIPDQYALAKLDELRSTRSSADPVFVFFPTITSHMPFRPTPPYQHDWSRVLTTDPFESDALAASLAQSPEWTNLVPAYADTLDYTLEYLGGYLSERAETDLLLIVIGDHQPPASVSGEGARWDVPVHVISNRHAVLDELLAAGFTQGLMPDAEPIGPMHELTNTLLRSFGTDHSVGSR